MKDGSRSKKSISRRDKTSKTTKNPEPEASRPSPCTVLAVVVTLFILIVLIVALGQFGFHDPSAFDFDPNADRPHRKRLNQSCQTAECVRYSAQLLDQIDSSVSPCTDFHTRVCSGFDPQKRRLERLLKLLEIRKQEEHKKAAGIVRKMLGKCVGEKKSVSSDWRSKILPPEIPFPILMSTVNKSFTDSPVTALIAHIAQHTPENIGGIMGIEPSQDSEFSLFVVKPNFQLPTEYAYRNVLEFLKPRGLHLDTDSVEQQLHDVMSMQKKLHEIPFSMKQELMNFTLLQEQIKEIDLKSLSNSLYSKQVGNYSLADKVFGFNTTYYKKVSEVITGYPKDTMLNLLFLHFSYNMLQTEISNNREEACLLQVSLSAPGRIMIFGSAEEKGLEELKNMLIIVRKHLRTSLANLKWMDSHGIEEALRKFENIDIQFGFGGEDLMSELIIPPKSDYIAILQTVLRWQTQKMFEAVVHETENVYLNTEVFYNVERNKITISRALLHYPFISANLPEYINFATISARILPQLVHVFDERGRFYDSNGKHRDWWNKKTHDLFHAIVACYESNMQDVLGSSISLGLNAYDSTLTPYALLPGYERSTDIALFFYSFVYTKCASDSEQVNEALANVPQFNSVFGCSRKLKSNGVQCKLAS